MRFLALELACSAGDADEGWSASMADLTAAVAVVGEAHPTLAARSDRCRATAEMGTPLWWTRRTASALIRSSNCRAGPPVLGLPSASGVLPRPKLCQLRFQLLSAPGLLLEGANAVAQLHVFLQQPVRLGGSIRRSARGTRGSRR